MSNGKLLLTNNSIQPISFKGLQNTAPILDLNTKFRKHVLDVLLVNSDVNYSISSFSSFIFIFFRNFSECIIL